MAFQDLCSTGGKTMFVNYLGFSKIKTILVRLKRGHIKTIILFMSQSKAKF